MYDVIILGSGPAGLSAAIYAQRARLSTLIIEEKPLSGGQILDTYEVDIIRGCLGLPDLKWARNSAPMQINWGLKW